MRRRRLEQRLFDDVVEALGLLDIREVAAVVDNTHPEPFRAKVRSIPDEAVILLTEDYECMNTACDWGYVDCAESGAHEWTGTPRIKALRHRQDRAYFLHLVTVSNIVLKGKFSPVGALPQASGDLRGPTGHTLSARRGRHSGLERDSQQ